MKITRQFSIKDGYLGMLSFIEDEFGDYPEPLKFQCCISDDFVSSCKRYLQANSDNTGSLPLLVTLDFSEYPLHVIYHEMQYFMDIALLFVSPSKINSHVSQTLPPESQEP